MEFITKKIEELKCSDEITLQSFIAMIIQQTCLKELCLTPQELSKVAAKISHQIDDVISWLEAVDSSVFKNIQCTCIIQILQVLYVKNSSQTANKKDCLVLAQLMITFADKLFPLTSKYECVSPEAHELNIKWNSVILKQCLEFFLVILHPDCDCETRKKNLSDSLFHLSQFQKYILKNSASKLLILVCSRLGNHVWTNKSLKELCSLIINVLCVHARCENIESLLVGENIIVFSNGLFKKSIDEIAVFFENGSWKKNVPLKHALIWTVTKVKYPHLGVYVPQVVSTLLRLIDDYSTENKVLGISTMDFVIQNVNPADLRLYNHADVMYEALFSQLFSNNDAIYEVSLPCLLKILKVIHFKSDYILGVEFTKWDISLEKIVQNLEVSGAFSTKKIFLRNLPFYVDSMGGNTIKHVDKIVSVSMLCLENYSEEIRLLALNVLVSLVKACWPVIPRYQVVILKAVTKVLVNVSMSTDSIKEIKCKLESAIQKLLLCLRACCGEAFDKLLLGLVDSRDINEKFSNIPKFIQNVLVQDVENML